VADRARELAALVLDPPYEPHRADCEAMRRSFERWGDCDCARSERSAAALQERAEELARLVLEGNVL
jgi:hypothetical protein